MLTNLIRIILRGLSVALAGTVGAVMFGPTLAANAATYFRVPARHVSAIKPLPEKQYPEVTNARAEATPLVTEPEPTTTSTPVMPFEKPTTSTITITPVVEATMTPGVTATAAAKDSAPVPSLPASPTAVATKDAEPTETPTATPKPKPTATKKPAPKPTKTASSVTRAAKVAAVLAFARAQLGERYVMGGMGPNTWDCSGLTKAAFASIGINIGTHSSNNQYETARAKGYLVPFSQKQAGDLVFYGTPGDIYHVAIYSGNGKIIEAANESEPVEERAYWGTPYTQVARFIR